MRPSESVGEPLAPSAPLPASRPSPRLGGRFLLVGIGASAGGPPAYRRLLSVIPAGAPLALVIVNHVRDAELNLLPGTLRLRSALPVLEAASGMPIKPGHVYAIPARRDLTLSPEGTAFEVRPVAKPHGWPRTVSTFLASLAQRWPGRAAAVILSGLDSDGADALCEVQAAGGRVYAQAPETAEHPDMPRHAILTGCVDGVLAPDAIAEALMQFAAQDPGE